MALYSSQYLKELSSNKSYDIRQKILNESRRTHTEFDFFLSHSFLDKDVVEGIYIELTNRGFSVYVDWIVDPQLDRENVTKETAEIIRKRMKSCKSLLLAISTNANLSKWIPWELGFVDGKTNDCVLFPVSNDSVTPTTFERKEYLLLYPYLKMADIENRKEICVTESSNMYITIGDWVRRNAKPSYQFKNIDLL